MKKKNGHFTRMALELKLEEETQAKQDIEKKQMQDECTKVDQSKENVLC